jgi:hypothetical protein
VCLGAELLLQGWLDTRGRLLGSCSFREPPQKHQVCGAWPAGGRAMPPPTLPPPYRTVRGREVLTRPRPNLTSHSPPPGRGVVVGWLWRAAALDATYYRNTGCVNRVALAGRSSGHRRHRASRRSRFPGQSACRGHFSQQRRLDPLLRPRRGIREGVLIEVSATAREAGIRWPVALTAAARARASASVTRRGSERSAPALAPSVPGIPSRVRSTTGSNQRSSS